MEPITDENWPDAAAALCRAAMTFETLLVQCCERHSDLFTELIAPNEEEIRLLSDVIGHWRKYLEITDGMSADSD